jgi:hypothetical protein
VLSQTSREASSPRKIAKNASTPPATVRGEAATRAPTNAGGSAQLEK